MADQKELRDRFMAVKSLLGIGNKRKPSLPPEAIERAVELVDELTRIVSPHSVMTDIQKREAREHPVSIQIQSLVDKDERSTAFFGVSYLLSQFEALPTDWKLVWNKRPKGRSNALKALIYYHCHKSKFRNLDDLKQYRDELEEDFNNHPESKRLDHLYATYRSLLRLPRQEDVVAKLEELFPTEKEIKAFAKDVGLRLPKRGAGSLHERLGATVYAKGAVTRL